MNKKISIIFFSIFICNMTMAQKNCSFLDENERDKKTGKLYQSVFFNMSRSRIESTNSQALKIVREGDSVYLALNISPLKKHNDIDYEKSTDDLTIVFKNGKTLLLKTDAVKKFNKSVAIGHESLSNHTTVNYTGAFYRIYYLTPEIVAQYSESQIDKFQYALFDEQNIIYFEDRFSSRIQKTFTCIKETIAP